MDRALAFLVTAILAAGLARAGQEEPPKQAPKLVPGAAANRKQGRAVQQQVPLNINQIFNQRNLGPRPMQVGAPIHEPFVEPMTAAKIRTAIDDAILYIRARQAADAHPASDETLRRALTWLAKLNVNNTYVRGIRANVWEYALRKVPYDTGIRAALKADYEWLLKALGDREGWRYNMQSRDWDNSCTQYGVLGIWAAARAGFEPGDAFWQRMSKHFRSCQNADGGWGYIRGGSSPNMATAGLASMFLVFDMYHGKSFYSAKNPRTFTSGDAAACLASLARGMTWLGASQGRKEDGYYLYGIERTGVASGRKYIGGEDWFKRGALAILKGQTRTGEMPMGGYRSVVGTSFCTLFLVYGGAPVAFNKLEYGKGQDWNLNPRDLANLTKHLWSAYERPLNWHSVSITAPASEFEAPILFISGSQPARFTEKQTLKLREFVERGGTILAEPSDGSQPFAKSITDLVQLMFPADQYPTYKLQPLPADHGVYTVLRQTWAKRPRLAGVSDGARTFLFLSRDYLSADWQMNRTESDAFKLATNLLFYATDLGALDGKFASILPDTKPAAARKPVAVVARVRHGGTPERPHDWEAGRPCWRQFAPYLAHVAGYKLAERPPVTLGKDKLDGIQLLHLTGISELTLSTAERSALKEYVEGGGTVLIDAYAGSAAFADSARRQVEAAFGKPEALDANSVLASGRFLGGADLSRGIRLKLPARRLLRERGVSPKGQKLEAICIDGRPAVLFSAFDLTGALAGIPSYRSVGYKPASARRIAANVLAHLLAD